MFGSYEPFLEISLQRNFQGLLSIVQLSRFLSFSQATALIFYQICFALSRTFLFSFVFCCPSRVSLNIIPLCMPYVNCFLQVFSTFFNLIHLTPYMVFYLILSHYSYRFYTCNHLIISPEVHLRDKKTTGPIQ